MLAVLVAVAAASGTPAQSASAALDDLRSLPPEQRGQTRYLSLCNFDSQERKTAGLAVDYLLAAVARSGRVARATRLERDELVRVDLAGLADATQEESYRELHTAWERLAAADPYFHLRTEVATADGLRQVTVDGGWVGLETAAALRESSGSFGAVLRADYFIARVATTPAYYEWAGVPQTQNELLAQLALDLRAINRLAADSAANLPRSQVTGKPRRILFRPGPLGGNWFTKDVAGEAPDKDPLRIPVDFAEQRFRFDASEVFFNRPNGMWGTALFDARGNRQDAVPVEIATDTTAPAGHEQLVPLISCLRCHELNGGRDGLQPFEDEQSRLGLPQSAVPAIEQRLAELYDPQRLARQMARDGEDYRQAVGAATGGATPDEATRALVDCYADYAYRAVTRGVAAAEVGLAVEELDEALAASGDPILLAIVRGGQVTRGSWDSSFPEAALLAEGWRQRAKRDGE